MKVWMRGRCGVLDRPPGGVDVGLVGAGQAADHRALDPAGDRLDGLEVAGRGDREAGLDHVDAEPARAAGRSRPSRRCSARCRATARRPSAWCRRCGRGLRQMRVPSGPPPSLLSSNDLVSRGYRAAQRYSPRRGRRRRSARLCGPVGHSTGKSSSLSSADERHRHQSLGDAGRHAVGAAGRRGAARSGVTFSPGPPERRSCPPPPLSRSLPGPPKSGRRPEPPIRTSSPSRPTSLSGPEPPIELVGARAADQHVVARAAAQGDRDRDARGDPDLVVARVGVDFEAADAQAAWQIQLVGDSGRVFADGAADFERDDRFDHVGAAVGRQPDADVVGLRARRRAARCRSSSSARAPAVAQPRRPPEPRSVIRIAFFIES